MPHTYCSPMASALFLLALKSDKASTLITINLKRITTLAPTATDSFLEWTRISGYSQFWLSPLVYLQLVPFLKFGKQECKFFRTLLICQKNPYL